MAYRYMVQVIPAWVVAPLYFKGKIELGVVSQVSRQSNATCPCMSSIGIEPARCQ